MVKVKHKNKKSLKEAKKKLRGSVSFSKTKHGIIAKKWPRKKSKKALYKIQKEKIRSKLSKNQGVKDSVARSLFLTGSSTAGIKSVNSISSKKLYFLRNGVAIYKQSKK